MYSGFCRVSSVFVYGAFTLSGRSFQDRSANLLESLMQSEPRSARTSVWALTISLAATLVIDFSFSSSGYLDVSVHRVPHHSLWIGLWLTGVFPAGFPHSDICGSMCICHSPQLFAAYHVFLRLLVPRHPPCALIAFLRSWFFVNDYFYNQHPLRGCRRDSPLRALSLVAASRSKIVTSDVLFSFTTFPSLSLRKHRRARIFQIRALIIISIQFSRYFV